MSINLTRISNPAKPLLLLFPLGALLISLPAYAVGDRLIEAIMRSDFIFDKNVSNVPFFPLGYLEIQHNDELSLDQDCPLSTSCDFTFSSLSQGFGLPVWVGKKDMIIVAETLESEQLKFDSRDLTINNAGVMAAWISQPTSAWQTGLFAYFYDSFDSDDNIEHLSGNVIGGGGRYRHSPGFHSYWGLVRIDEGDDPVIYPYIGFDWFVGKTISINALVPWPSISYSPDTNTIYKFGATVSGSDWLIDNNGRMINNSLGMVDFALVYERRLSGLIWAEFGTGYSGLSRISIDADNDVDFDANLEPSPFLRFSINLRPE